MHSLSPQGRDEGSAVIIFTFKASPEQDYAVNNKEKPVSIPNETNWAASPPALLPHVLHLALR